ncbi:hypothetical protein N4R57_09225 [Rhodobacteraceae bacterium D3-12]|nr:hypothetical protein N4R57_09225 [Rhodobacteraceae bacterium D3-12]
MDDFPNNTMTTGTVSLESQATGNFDSQEDLDWFAAYLHSDVTYHIVAGGYEPLLNLYDTNGAFIRSANESDVANARFIFQPVNSGRYFFEVGTNDYDLSYSMTYTLALYDVSDDFSDDATSPGLMSVNDSTLGALEQEYDEDWIGFFLAEGERARIVYAGANDNGAYALDYPNLLGVYDEDGTFLGAADDGVSGPGWPSSEFTAPNSGPFCRAERHFCRCWPDRSVPPVGRVAFGAIRRRCAGERGR